MEMRAGNRGDPGFQRGVIVAAINGVAFTGEVKLVRNATCDEKKAEAHHPEAGSPEPSLPAPFDRIRDPQIPLTRRFEIRRSEVFIESGLAVEPFVEHELARILGIAV